MQSTEIRNNYQLHFVHSGIKGMHWGERRYQNADGSYTEAGKQRYAKKYGEISEIKAGSKVYRTVGSKDENVGGNKYVTYYKNDTKFYRGEGARWVASMQNKTVKDLYTNTYKTTGPIQVATSKTVNQTLNDMISKDKNLSNRMADGFSSMMMRNQGLSEKGIEQCRTIANAKTEKQKQTLSNKAFKDMYDDLSKQIPNESKDILKRYCSEQIKNRNDWYKYYKDRASQSLADKDTASSAFYKTAALGRPELQDVKDNLIKNLGNKGYGAMTDIAGVGGAGTGRETRQALIVFNTDVTLSKMKSEPVMKYYSSSRRTYKDPARGKYKNLMLM